MWATPTLETCVAVVGVLLSGAAAVPLNPKMGSRELEHVLRDSTPGLLVAPRGEDLPGPVDSLPAVAVDLDGDEAPLAPEPDDESPAFVFYTSGTTGPPKGVVLPRRAVASNLDALAEVWQWTGDDVLTHGLPRTGSGMRSLPRGGRSPSHQLRACARGARGSRWACRSCGPTPGSRSPTVSCRTSDA